MLYDFATIRNLPASQVAHHTACLVCHGYVISLGTAAAFPWYFRGVAALEAGSAACNLSAFWPEDTRLARVYLAVMTLSNAATLACMRHWVHATASSGGKLLGATVTVLLVVGRQYVAIEAARESHA